jgi:hypothetical protein
LDNSGDTGHYQWINNLTYRHWEIRGGDWAGKYDPVHHNYTSLSQENLIHSIKVVNAIVDMFKHHPAIIGFQPGK